VCCLDNGHAADYNSFMTARRAYFIHSKQLEQFQYPPSCPFNSSRAGKVRELARSLGLLSGKGISEIAPPPAERILLKKFHTARYLHTLKAADKGRFEPDAIRMGIGSSDCPVFSGMYGYSELACGATALGARLILDGKADVAYNPSGGLHHAMPEKASGFCYMNDNAIACLLLAEAGRKVLYFDVDVHFGDGVAYCFYDRSDVMTISFHEDPRMLFPGTGFVEETGSGDGKGYCVSVPLPAGTYDSAYLRCFNTIVMPLIDAFGPDVIVFELGADALAGDPLGHLYLTNNTYVEIINSLLRFRIPILMTGGGGYDIENTVRAWTLAWSVLSGAETMEEASIGAGGILLENTEWQGGLRDRQIQPTNQQQGIVEPQIERLIDTIRRSIFHIHGL